MIDFSLELEIDDIQSSKLYLGGYNEYKGAWEQNLEMLILNIFLVRL